MQKIELNGLWDFAFSKDSEKLPNHFSDVMTVPGCFDTTVNYAGKRGIGFYRRWLELDKNLNYRLILQGVAHNSSVYLNRRLLGNHHGAFTTFSVPLIPYFSGKHELIITADNRFDGLNRPLHMPHFDWYSYGGIIRPVILECYRDVLIEQILPIVTDWKKGKIFIKIEFQYAHTAPLYMPIEIIVDGQQVFRGTLRKSQPTFNVDIRIPNPKPWTPESPHLHSLAIKVGSAQKSVHVGLRQITTRGSKILLNGNPIRLKGINRHDSCVLHGFSLPETLHLYDVQKIRELGCNFVRTSHYPPDEKFIEICDRYGLMVWCEATSWGYDEAMTIDPRTVSMQRQCIQEMIKQYAHHPSIVCWGFFNECAAWSKKAKPVYKEIVALIRRLDPTRPITYATNCCHPALTVQEAKVEDLMFEYVDWISINVYPGWYQGNPDDAVKRLDNLAKLMKRMKLNKPIIVSEIGAGGIAGFDHYFPVKWSLAYQNILLGNLIEYIRKQKFFGGAIIWHFSDIFTSEERWQRRPKQYNDKGLLDEFRREKPVFQTVRAIFHKPW